MQQNVLHWFFCVFFQNSNETRGFLIAGLTPPFKQLVKTHMTLLKLKQANAKHFKGLIFTYIWRSLLKVCRCFNTLSAVFHPYFLNSVPSLAMDILAIPTCTDITTDLLRSRHRKGNVSNTILRLWILMHRGMIIPENSPYRTSSLPTLKHNRAHLI